MMNQSFADDVRTPGHLPPEELARVQQLYATVLMESDLTHAGSIGRIPRTYAEVLLNVAFRGQKVAAITSNLVSLLSDLFPHVPGLERFLTSPAASRKTKDAAIVALFDGRAEGEFVNFLRVLNRNDRLGMLRLIWVAYRALLEERFGRQRVLVETAAPLTDEDRKKLSDALTGVLNKTPVLVVRERPDLIGGLVVHLGDKVIDTSVRTKLTTIRNNMLSRGANALQRL